MIWVDSEWLIWSNLVHLLSRFCQFQNGQSRIHTTYNGRSVGVRSLQKNILWSLLKAFHCSLVKEFLEVSDDELPGDGEEDVARHGELPRKLARNLLRLLYRLPPPVVLQKGTAVRYVARSTQPITRISLCRAGSILIPMELSFHFFRVFVGKESGKEMVPYSRKLIH